METGRAETARILIVDDEPANVRLLERLLQQGGYTQVESLSDPREVLGRVRTAPPDLVLLDLLMPHLDGVDVMRQLLAESRAEEFRPVLVLTADATPEAKRRALEAGASDFLTKPFDSPELLLRVRNLLRIRSLHQDLQRQNARLEQVVRERTQQLVEAERLVTMGELLAGVAHELNNPLTVVVGHAQLLEQAWADTPAGAQAAKISGAADRCVRIVRNFLAMARRRPPERARVALDRVVRDVCDLLAYELRAADVAVVLDLAEDVPALWADGHQLQQVAINLVVNALHAMRKGPRPRRLQITTRYEPAPRLVRLTVKDTGPGVPPEIAERIFEPLFTTKPEGEGTGLGLSICRGLIEAHGGGIRLIPSSADGATFEIELPVLKPQMFPGEAAPQVAAPPRPARLLVVDDEADIAALLAQGLALDGHVVETAANGAEALERLQRAAFDLVISDSGMPVLSGPDLYRELQRRDPSFADRFIFVSGDVLNRQTETFIREVGALHLRKPFAIEAVRAVVAEALRRAPER